MPVAVDWLELYVAVLLTVILVLEAILVSRSRPPDQ
jgi:hypothetical protein